LYRKWIELGFIGILLIGGGFVVKGMQYDTPALKDSFTRDFIIQDKQATEGFHLFESKIGTYKMLFPSDFQLVSDSPEFYGRQGNSYEVWLAYAELAREERKSVEIKGTFRLLGEGRVEEKLQILKSENGRTKDYEVDGYDNKLIFLEKIVKNYDSNKKRMVLGNPNKQDANVYYGFVADKTTNQSFELDYTIRCQDDCSIDVEKELNFMKTMLESVEFYN